MIFRRAPCDQFVSVNVTLHSSYLSLSIITPRERGSQEGGKEMKNLTIGKIISESKQENSRKKEKKKEE